MIVLGMGLGFAAGVSVGLGLAVYLGNPHAFRRAFLDGYERVPS